MPAHRQSMPIRQRWWLAYVTNAAGCKHDRSGRRRGKSDHRALWIPAAITGWKSVLEFGQSRKEGSLVAHFASLRQRYFPYDSFGHVIGSYATKSMHLERLNWNPNCKYVQAMITAGRNLKIASSSDVIIRWRWSTRFGRSLQLTGWF